MDAAERYAENACLMVHCVRRGLVWPMRRDKDGWDELWAAMRRGLWAACTARYDPAWEFSTLAVACIRHAVASYKRNEWRARGRTYTRPNGSTFRRVRLLFSEIGERVCEAFLLAADPREAEFVQADSVTDAGAAIAGLLRAVPERMRYALRLRYGIGCRPHKLDEMRGPLGGVSRARVSHYLRVGLELLREAMNDPAGKIDRSPLPPIDPANPPPFRKLPARKNLGKS